jgi:sigma-B regulation protein RsbU (phosphoserine phosphatase)
MSHLSIRTLLILGILLPLSVVYTLFVIDETRRNRDEAIRHVESRLVELVGKHAAQIDGDFFAASKIPETLAGMLSVDTTQNEEDFEAIIREVLTSSPRFIGMCIAFESNTAHNDAERFAPYVHRKHPGSSELLSSDLAQTYKEDYRTWDWYRIPKETSRSAWSEPYFDEGGGNVLMCTYSVPFFRDGHFAGVVTVDVGLDSIREDMSRISPEGVIYRLLSTSGTFIAAPEQEFVMKETIFSVAEKYHNEQLVEIGHDLLRGNSGVVSHNGVFNNCKMWMAYVPLSRSGYGLMASIPESQVLAPVYVSLFRSIILFFILFTIISALIVVTSWRLTSPIKRLAKFARKLAAGDLNAHVGDVRFAGEIDQLARTFDKMVVDLKSNIEHRIREETARKTVEGELKAARRIQASLLPRVFPPFPDRSEFDLYATNEPAAYVAGDFFDFFFIEPNTLAFVIADVSGHGIPAALFMAVSRTAIRNFAVPERSPREIIDRVNQILSTDNDDMMFVTLFYGHYAVQTGELTYVNAGHNPPYIVRKDGHLEKLKATGPLVATFEGITYGEGTVRLEKGDLLVTFTDGVTEAHSTRDNILFGEERLERLLSEVYDESVSEICRQISNEADRFSGNERHDDITLLVLRRNGYSNS